VSSEFIDKDCKMKINDKTKYTAYFALLTIIILSGFYIAYVIGHKYALIAQGVLGCSVFYLLQRLFFPKPKSVHEPITNLIEFPKNIKYLALGFVLSMIMYWAVENVIYMLFWLIKVTYIS
jgi:hypothetical protein